MLRLSLSLQHTHTHTISAKIHSRRVQTALNERQIERLLDCNTIQHTTLNGTRHVDERNATRMQHTATRCNTWHSTEHETNGNSTAIYCNTLQLIALNGT